MLLFWKLIDEKQILKPPEPTTLRSSIKSLILLPLRADLLCTLQHETPCKHVIISIVKTNMDKKNIFLFNCFVINFHSINSLLTTRTIDNECCVLSNIDTCQWLLFPCNLCVIHMISKFVTRETNVKTNIIIILFILFWMLFPSYYFMAWWWQK